MSPSPAWEIVYYEAAGGLLPAVAFLSGCPLKVRARLLAVLDDVAEAPPPQFSGGGRWEAMHGIMAGFYEARGQGAEREQFRLFCVLENANPAELQSRGLSGPSIAVMTGLRKPWMTKFTPADYRRVIAIRTAYLSTLPRPLAT